LVMTNSLVSTGWEHHRKCPGNTHFDRLTVLPDML
jgi:hypothetical protein